MEGNPLPSVGGEEGGGVGIRSSAWEDFFCKWWEPKEELFWNLEPFLWTPTLKIKIRMTCVCKGYEIETKMVQEQWLPLKMKFLLGCKMKIFKFLFSGGEWLTFGRGIKIWWDIEGWANFLLVLWDFPMPSLGKTWTKYDDFAHFSVLQMYGNHYYEQLAD